MRIQSYNPYIYPKSQNFTGIMHIDRKNAYINDGWFFRDSETLEKSANIIKMNFPKGADIWDFASSTGEETVSLKILLPEDRYIIKGYDCSEDALRLGKRGVYSVFSDWYDSYLLPVNDCFITREEFKDFSGFNLEKRLMIREKFHQVMEEVPKIPEYDDINNKTTYFLHSKKSDNFIEKFYRMREEFKDKILLNEGNFLCLGTYKKERPVGGIFFRNAIYHLCENNINEVLEYNVRPNQYSNKHLLMRYIVNNVSKKLDEGGIFVTGNHVKEHLYWADEATPDRVYFCQTPYYNPALNKHKDHKYLYCYKESPLTKALLESKQFEPIHYSFVNFADKLIKVPVIWRKIKP